MDNRDHDVGRTWLDIIFRLLHGVNPLLCRALYGLSRPTVSPLPPHGPVLLVANHVSFNDPMVLEATAGRRVRFLMAREIYEQPSIRWVCRAFENIPVTRGGRDIGAVRTILAALRNGEVIAIFPEGGIEKHREEDGHVGVGYLALKTGAPVVPAAIAWDSDRPRTLFGMLLKPGKVVVRYGPPVFFHPNPRPRSDSVRDVTSKVMIAIRDLEKELGTGQSRS